MDSPPVTRTTSRGFLSPYRFGERKWEDYLLDTQTLIYAGAKGQIDATTRLRIVAEEGNALQSQLLESFQTYAARAGVAWDRISDQLDTLTDTLASGFTTLNDTLEFHGELLKSISGKLERVVFALEKRLDTEAKELFDNGRVLMGRQLYPEALADFRSAETKRPVNPLLHLHLAQLHYAVLDKAVPFSFDTAEQHINLAIRYARALLRDLGPDGKKILDLVHRTAADIAYRKAGDASKDGNSHASTQELRRALGFLTDIDEPSPSSRFFKAQIEALLGNADVALADIRSLADYTRSWVPRSLLESNLLAISNHLGDLGEVLARDPGPHTKAVQDVATRTKAFAQGATSADLHSGRCSALQQTADKILKEFYAGGIAAPSACSQIRTRREELRRSIRADLTAAVARAQAVAAEQEGHRSKALGGLNSFSDEFREILGPVAGGAFVVAAIVGIWNWSQPAFMATFLILMGAATVWLFVTVQNQHTQQQEKADEAAAIGGKARREDEDCQRRLRVLNEAESVLDEDDDSSEPTEQGGVAIIKSPIVGTVHRAAGPNQPNFVEVGHKVRKGQVLCVIEAMRLMNEIESDIDGKVAAIHAENGRPVQFGDPLFSIKPSNR